MNQHPLTDEICDEIQESIYVIDPFEDLKRLFPHGFLDELSEKIVTSK